MSQSSRPKGIYNIRHAVDHNETNLVWSRFMLELGWDRYGDDLATYMDHSKTPGMLLAFREDSYQPIGHIAAVANDNSTGWVAMFIVDAPFRGDRVGATLWDAMMQDFRDCKTEIIGLHAVPAQKKTYERRGFVDSSLGRIEWMARPLSLATVPASPTDVSMVDIHEIPAELLAQFELKYDGFFRPRLWTNLLTRSDVVGYAHVKLSPPGSVSDILSCGVMRRAPNGARIGPLIATDEILAENILCQLVAAATPEYILSHELVGTSMSSLSAEEIRAKAHIVAEPWTGNKKSLAVFERHGFESLGYCHRMWYQGKATSQHLEGGLAQVGLFAAFDAAIG